MDMEKIKQAIALHEESDAETLQFIRPLFNSAKSRYQKLATPKVSEKKVFLKYSNTKISEAKRLRFKGISYKEISKVTGIPQGSLSRVLKTVHTVSIAKKSTAKKQKHLRYTDDQILKGSGRSFMRIIELYFEKSSVEEQLPRLAHNQEVVGATPATTKNKVIEVIVDLKKELWQALKRKQAEVVK